MSTATYRPRRAEFSSEDPAAVRSILAKARWGSLATVDSEGFPEVRPMNYSVVDDSIYFHTGPKGALPQRAGSPAAFTVVEAPNWLPSYWRHEELACPATTYYSSLVLRGVLEVAPSRDERAAALEAFMQRYQSEGGYLPFSDSRYDGPLASLSVLKLTPTATACKLKFGQHLSEKPRRQVYEGLLGRSAAGDLATAEAMREHNADLRTIPEGVTLDPATLAPEAIWGLLRGVYWAYKRSPEICATNRARALAQCGFFQDGKLVGYARIEGQWLYDVVVDPGLRGRGVGKAMLGALLAHPRIAALPRLFLDTRDAMSLYERYGFRIVDASPWGSNLMVRYGSPDTFPVKLSSM